MNCPTCNLPNISEDKVSYRCKNHHKWSPFGYMKQGHWIGKKREGWFYQKSGDRFAKLRGPYQSRVLAEEAALSGKSR